VQEIFERVDQELEKAGRSGMLPSGVILTGGGAKLSGILEAAKTTLRLPVSLGIPMGVTSVIDRINDPGMTTAIGLVLWGRQIRGESQKGLGGMLKSVKHLDRLGEAVKKIFSSLRP
jgi:cell division protein FtsA